MVGRWATRHGDRYLLARFEFRYGIPIGEGYGRSDSSCISTANPLAGPRKAGSVGLPLPGSTTYRKTLSARLTSPGCDTE